MSHTERQDVTYYSGHVIDVNGKLYAPERTCYVKPVGNAYMCLECRAITDKDAVSGMSSSFCVKYCPNCGAKILGVKLVVDDA